VFNSVHLTDMYRVESISMENWGGHVKAIFGEINHQLSKDADNASMLLSKISSIK